MTNPKEATIEELGRMVAERYETLREPCNWYHPGGGQCLGFEVGCSGKGFVPAVTLDKLLDVAFSRGWAVGFRVLEGRCKVFFDDGKGRQVVSQYGSTAYEAAVQALAAADAVPTVPSQAPESVVLLCTCGFTTLVNNGMAEDWNIWWDEAHTSHEVHPKDWLPKASPVPFTLP